MKKFGLTLLIILAVCPKLIFASLDPFHNAVAGFVNSVPLIIKERSGSLCVYGYDHVAVILEEKYGNALFFKDLQSFKRFPNSDCKALYISKNNDRMMVDAIEAANRKKITSLGISENFIENGGTIFIQMGRRNIELIMNHDKVKENNIKFNPVISNLVIN